MSSSTSTSTPIRPTTNAAVAAVAGPPRPPLGLASPTRATSYPKRTTLIDDPVQNDSSTHSPGPTTSGSRSTPTPTPTPTRAGRSHESTSTHPHPRGQTPSTSHSAHHARTTSSRPTQPLKSLVVTGSGCTCVGCKESIGDDRKGKRRRGYCGRCVQAGLSSHAEATQILTAQLEATRKRSYSILSTGHSNLLRIKTGPQLPKHHQPGLIDQINLLATHTARSNTSSSLRTELTNVKARNTSVRENMRGRRDEVLKRRAGLVLGRGKIVPDSDVGSTIGGIGRDGKMRSITNSKSRDWLETTPHTELAQTRKENLDLQERLVHARRVLVGEVIEVMGVRNRGQRAAGGVANGGREGEEVWEIASLPFLLPRDQPLRSTSGHPPTLTSKPTSTINHPKRTSTSTPTSISGPPPTLRPNYHNALLGHIVHVLTLISSYLDVMLPFEVFWNDKSIGSKAHVGKVYLSAKGRLPFIVPLASSFGKEGKEEKERDKVEEAMWRKEGVLYVSTGREKWRKRLKGEVNDGHGRGKVRTSGVTDMASGGNDGKPTPGPSPSKAPTTTPSTLNFGGRDKHQEKEDQLVLAYTMLVMDVAYLAHTQGVDLGIPKVKRGVDEGGGESAYVHALDDLASVLRWIGALGKSDLLGSASHLASATQMRSIALSVNFTDLHEQMRRAFSEYTVNEGEAVVPIPVTLEMPVEDDEWDVL